MFKRFRNILYKIHDSADKKDLKILSDEINKIKFIQGQILESNRKNAKKHSFIENEYKVFSQFGDDGLIQFVIDKLNLNDNQKSFIEFGVEDYSESNTRFLLQLKNWKGLVLDGAEENIEKIEKDLELWKYDLTAKKLFITCQNINQIFEESNFIGEIGILSIDIDGNDYWVWEAIEVVNPIVVICEYNSLFGPNLPLSIPYQEDFFRKSADNSNKYWGASISALTSLAEKKGYTLIGSNTAGNNCYFIRNDFADRFEKKSPNDCWVQSKFRETKVNGSLKNLTLKEFYSTIRKLELVNVTTGNSHLAEEFINQV